MKKRANVGMGFNKIFFKDISLSFMQKRATASEYLEIQPITDIVKGGSLATKAGIFTLNCQKLGPVQKYSLKFSQIFTRSCQSSSIGYNI